MHKSQDQPRSGWVTTYYKSILPLTGSTTRQYYSYSYCHIHSLKACLQGVPRDLKTTVVKFSLWHKVLPNTGFLSEMVRFSCLNALPTGKWCYTRHPLISLILDLYFCLPVPKNSNTCSKLKQQLLFKNEWWGKKYFKFSLFGLMKIS